MYPSPHALQPVPPTVAMLPVLSIVQGAVPVLNVWVSTEAGVAGSVDVIVTLPLLHIVTKWGATTGAGGFSFTVTVVVAAHPPID